MVHSAECQSKCQCSETETHFLRCPHIARQELYNSFVQQLPRLMRKHHLDPDLQHALLSLLDTARIQQSPPFTRDYVKILQQQRKLGNDSVFFGFFTTDWINMQKDYLQLMKLPSTRNEANTCMTQITIYIYITTYTLYGFCETHMYMTQISTKLTHIEGSNYYMRLNRCMNNNH